MIDGRVSFEWGGNSRSTLTLLWTCLTTIFACTYTVVHLDFPRITDTPWRVTRRRISWFLRTLLIPEYTLATAIRQHKKCSEVTELMKSLRYDKCTRAHSFYLSMGGYRLQGCGVTIRRLDKKWVDKLHNKDVEPPFRLPKLSQQQIKDHGRADSLAKAIVCTSAGWIIIESIARAVENLPISQLEIMTLAYVAIALLSNCFWWKKPFDARIPVIIPVDANAYTSPAHLFANLGRELNDDWDGRSDPMAADLSFAVAGAIFGAIHCIGWNFSFASRSEQVIWRTCSVIITAMPVVVRSLLQIARITFRAEKSSWFAGGLLSDPWFIIVLWFYMAARATLIFQTMFCLRSMPAGTYTSAAWVNYIPHFG